MRKFLGLLMALSLVLAISTPAAAQENAGEDEYTEGVPGGGGESPSGEGGESPSGENATSGPGSGAPLPPSILNQFQNAGADGAAAAALAERLGQGGSGKLGQGGSGNDPRGDSANGASTPSGVDNAARDGSNGGGFVGAVDEVLTPGSDSGLGVLLPAILGLALLAAMLLLVARVRSGHSDTPA